MVAFFSQCVPLWVILVFGALGVVALGCAVYLALSITFRRGV